MPAQPAAGVVKSVGRGYASLKELAAEHPGCAVELEKLEEEAVLGRGYLSELKQEVVRLGLLAGMGLDHDTLVSMTEKLSRKELLAMKEAYGRRAEEQYPLNTQLEYGEKAALQNEKDQAFLI